MNIDDFLVRIEILESNIIKRNKKLLDDLKELNMEYVLLVEQNPQDLAKLIYHRDLTAKIRKERTENFNEVDNQLIQAYKEQIKRLL